jgi:hypothetical protein
VNVSQQLGALTTALAAHHPAAAADTNPAGSTAVQQGSTLQSQHCVAFSRQLKGSKRHACAADPYCAGGTAVHYNTESLTCD